MEKLLCSMESINGWANTSYLSFLKIVNTVEHYAHMYKIKFSFT